MRRRVVGAVTAAALLSVLGLAVARGRGAEAVHPVPVEPRPVAAPDAAPPLDPSLASMVGVVLSERTADVTSRNDGRLRVVGVRLGDHVEEGAVMAAIDVTVTRFDVPRARAALRSMASDVQRAEVQAAQQRDRRARKERLFDSGLASAEDVEASRYEERSARLQVDGLRAERASRAADLGKLEQVRAEAEIRAPFSGVVARRYVDPGASVTASTPVIRLVGDGGRFVRFAAPEPLARRLHVGAAVLVRATAGDLRATIERIAPEIDGASRTLAVEASLHPDAARGVTVGETISVTWEPDGR